MKIFAQRVLQLKFDATFGIKKPFVTPKFCGQNFSQMHHFEDMNFLSPLDFLYLPWRRSTMVQLETKKS